VARRSSSGRLLFPRTPAEEKIEDTDLTYYREAPRTNPWHVLRAFCSAARSPPLALVMRPLDC
jgi:hypothetical protein